MDRKTHDKIQRDYNAYVDAVYAKGCEPVTYAEWMLHSMSAGRLAYEADCKRKPRHDNGEPRKSWFELSDVGRNTWQRRALA